MKTRALVFSFMLLSVCANVFFLYERRMALDRSKCAQLLSYKANQILAIRDAIQQSDMKLAQVYTEGDLSVDFVRLGRLLSENNLAPWAERSLVKTLRKMDTLLRKYPKIVPYDVGQSVKMPSNDPILESELDVRKEIQIIQSRIASTPTDRSKP